MKKARKIVYIFFVFKGLFSIHRYTFSGTQDNNYFNIFS